MYNVKSLKAEEFISDEEIKETLEYAEANKNNIGLIDAIIEKAKLKKGLTHREASVLLACKEGFLRKQNRAFCTALSVKLLCERLCLLSISHEK